MIESGAGPIVDKSPPAAEAAVPVTDFTLVTCSYNTPEVTLAMLRSFAHHHRRDWPVPLLLMENSTTEATAELLDLYSIPFLRAPGMMHSRAVDRALKMIRTDYALVVDTDLLFRGSIEGLLDKLRSSGATIMGEWQEDRSGFHFHPRIAPYFTLLNVRNIQEIGIFYHDQTRIDATQSSGFYEMKKTIPDPAQRYYDVGATFLEDILAAGLTARPIEEFGPYVYHAGALSWGATSDVPTQDHIRRTNKIFWDIAAATAQTDIRGAFRDHEVR